MEIVLVHPEIPPNTGCAARLCAALGLRLHLVEPLGFSLDSKHLRRAGLDYWPEVEMHVHADWAAAAAHLEEGVERPLAGRLRPFTARGGTSLFKAAFHPDDVLLFGCESRGLPPELLGEDPSSRIYIPVRRSVRSLNLANSICLGAYTALLRAGLPLPDNDGAYDPPDRSSGSSSQARRMSR